MVLRQNIANKNITSKKLHYLDKNILRHISLVSESVIITRLNKFRLLESEVVELDEKELILNKSFLLLSYSNTFPLNLLKI